MEFTVFPTLPVTELRVPVKALRVLFDDVPLSKLPAVLATVFVTGRTAFFTPPTAPVSPVAPRAPATTPVVFPIAAPSLGRPLLELAVLVACVDVPVPGSEGVPDPLVNPVFPPCPDWAGLPWRDGFAPPDVC